MSINLKKYQGLWYEIAKKPVFFQLQCLSDTTAKYTLKDDYVEVENSCKSLFGLTDTIKGKAFFTDKPNVLQVQFSPLAPKADYVVEYVDRKYKNAIVGSPSKRYLWFLSREKNIPEEKFNTLKDIAISKNYDLSNLQMTKQTIL